MARLFVANCTRQNQEIHYRLDLDETGRIDERRRFQPAKRMTIAPGRQVALGGDLHMTQITDIIDQLRPFGLIGVVDVPRMKSIAPYVFDIDKQIQPFTINSVMAVNAGIHVQDGKDRRARAAIAVNETVAATVSHEFAANQIPKEPEQEVEVEVEQLEQSEAGEKRIEEGYRISAKAPDKPTKKNSTNRRGK